MAFSFKVAAMSFLETAASLAEQFNPLWILPEWLRNMVVTALKVRPTRELRAAAGRE